MTKPDGTFTVDQWAVRWSPPRFPTMTSGWTTDRELADGHARELGAELLHRRVLYTVPVVVATYPDPDEVVTS